jgi:hypothetical protein
MREKKLPLRIQLSRDKLQRENWELKILLPMARLLMKPKKERLSEQQGQIRLSRILLNKALNLEDRKP